MEAPVMELVDLSTKILRQGETAARETAATHGEGREFL